jgi:ABC-type transporter Mla subunit MlaD
MTTNPWQPWTKAQADALRTLNAPLLAAVERQQEAARALAAMAEQLTALAEQQAEVTRVLRAALKPYQDYLAWLDGGR